MQYYCNNPLPRMNKKLKNKKTHFSYKLGFNNLRFMNKGELKK